MPLWCDGSTHLYFNYDVAGPLCHCGKNNHFYLNFDVASPLCHCGAVEALISISTMVWQAIYATVVRCKDSYLSQL